MNKRIYENRREKLRALMKAERIKSLLVQSAANRYYLSGFELHDPQPNESAGWLIIMEDGQDILCTDSRYFDAAKRLWDEKNIFIYQGSAPEQVCSFLRSKSMHLAYDSRYMTMDCYDRFGLDLGLLKVDGLVERLRCIKDAEELKLMEASCNINHKLMEWLPSTLVPGKTEKSIAWEIEQFFRNNGAEETAFASIVAINGNGALPHAIPCEDVLTENCSILIDVGCRYEGYCSDQTRTFWVGNKPSDKFLFTLEAVKAAQAKAIEGMHPGVKASDIYALAKTSLDNAGIGEFFTHGLGHGVGLETHEFPSLGPTRDTILEPGMVITVEPGVYYSGEFGIRWEYMIAITEDGHKIL